MNFVSPLAGRYWILEISICFKWYLCQQFAVFTLVYNWIGNIVVWVVGSGSGESISISGNCLEAAQTERILNFHYPSIIESQTRTLSSTDCYFVTDCSAAFSDKLIKKWPPLNETPKYLWFWANVPCELGDCWILHKYTDQHPFLMLKIFN